MSMAVAIAVYIRTRATRAACLTSGLKTSPGGGEGNSGFSPGPFASPCGSEPLNSCLSLNHITAPGPCQQSQLLDIWQSAAILDAVKRVALMLRDVVAPEHRIAQSSSRVSGMLGISCAYPGAGRTQRGVLVSFHG